jgi:uncharacterized protein (DUF924 family)
VTVRDSIASVLQFWFGAASDEAEVIRQQSDLWWKKNPAIDDEMRARFEPLVTAALNDALSDWHVTPAGQLARILLCDQFTRSIYRNTPQAFAGDPQARAWARDMINAGSDQALRFVECVFVYMPLEHSESPADQHESVQRFVALHDVVPTALKIPFQNFLDYAVRHKNVVDRFGRFPHRNAILGRRSTPEEIEFLQQPASSF